MPNMVRPGANSDQEGTLPVVSVRDVDADEPPVLVVEDMAG